MSRLTQQLATVSKSLIRISEQLTKVAMQLDKAQPPAAVAKTHQKTAELKKQ